MRIEYHRTLIADKVRNDAFYNALKRVIVPGETVVADIGAGTGLLGLMASKLGAKDVFLFEAAEVAGVAAHVLKANNARNCHLLPCHSTEFRDSLTVDVVVSETLGNYALEENIVETMRDARQRFLKKGGVIVPGAITQFVAPVIARRIHQELTVWDHVGRGIDLSAAKAMSLNNVYVRRLKPADLFDEGASARIWDRVDFYRENRANRRGEAEWRFDGTATVFGFAAWWVADLGAGQVLSTGPEAARTHWEQLYFPLIDPLRVHTGQSVALRLRSQSSEQAGTHLAWSVQHLDGAKRSLGRQSLDLDKGFLP